MESVSKLSIISSNLKSNPSKENKDAAILFFDKLAKNFAGHYYKLSRVDYDDLYGEAILAVVQAVNSFLSCKHDNLGGLVNKYITGRILTFLKKTSNHSPIIEEIVADNKIQSEPIEEIIDRITKNKKEKRILELRYQGYSSKEISQILKLSRQRIWVIRQNIAERYQRLVK